MKKIIYIVGTGTIGEPLIGLLTNHLQDFGLDELVFYKHTPSKIDRSKVIALQARGGKLAVAEDSFIKFQDLEVTPTYTHDEALEKASVVVDCTPIGNKNKLIYKNYTSNTLGFVAQGSEFGFGKMYARGINDLALHKDDKFIHIVSCNTHNLAAILQTIVFPDNNYQNLRSGKFLCIRRANDISQTEGFAPSPTINSHKDLNFGTHHAKDAYYLYKTLDINLDSIFSSAIKVNSQYMHTLYFTLQLNNPTTLEEIKTNINTNPRLAQTWKTSANTVFSFGRDHGHFGRILNQTVFCLPSLHVSSDGKEVTGFCFTPQDGNSILSSAAAALWFFYPESYEKYLKVLDQYYFNEV